jgi:two-component system chemotaxis response regulator CheB
MTLVKGLEGSLPACVLIVVHSSSKGLSYLSRILKGSTPLPVSLAEDGQPLEHGIVIAQSDRHLVVTPGRMRVTHGPKENGFRPAIDPLFRTAAAAYGPRVIGIVLSGGLDDGTSGLAEIKARGGLAIVQDPNDASVKSMPQSAIRLVDVDHVLPSAAIAPLLQRESRAPVEGAVAMGRSQDDPRVPGVETDIADLNSRLGPPSALTCPDCGGALWQVADRNLVRYQCHVGHRYSPESLVVFHDERVEGALWSAVRALEERADLRRRMASQTEAAGLAAVSESFGEQAQEATEQANRIRELLTRPGRDAADVLVEEEEVEQPRRKRRRQR